MQEELFDQFSKDLRKMLLNVEDDLTFDHQEAEEEDTLSDEEFALLKKEFEELLGDDDDE